jgi:hypothetical protein
MANLRSRASSVLGPCLHLRAGIRSDGSRVARVRPNSSAPRAVGSPRRTSSWRLPRSCSRACPACGSQLTTSPRTRARTTRREYFATSSGSSGFVTLQAAADDSSVPGSLPRPGEVVSRTQASTEGSFDGKAGQLWASQGRVQRSTVPRPRVGEIGEGQTSYRRPPYWPRRSNPREPRRSARLAIQHGARLTVRCPTPLSRGVWGETPGHIVRTRPPACRVRSHRATRRASAS